ncbi:hypothetical protein [Alteromonas flava]|uniref:hypothetical protein n=1 Tax=Alteromonas flava TaxID=2048003 RepID=UPI000C284BFB|nr:hypothetical protein [Alteromonas flava]
MRLSFCFVRTLIATLLGVVLATPVGAQAVRDQAQKLAELRMGTVYYHYFQQQPLETLHAVAIAKTKGLSAEQLAQLQLVQGGASLQLGMTSTATQLLQDLLANTQAPELQAQAWYWLAHTAFQQGQYATSQQAAQRLNEQALAEYIEPEQQQEIAYQAAFYQIQQAPQDWRQILSGFNVHSDWYPYLLANVGVQLFNQDKFQQASARFLDAIEAARAPKPVPFDWSFAWLNPANASWWPWAENTVALTSAFTEHNALLDRLYYMLGQAFVRQNDFDAAFNAYKHIQSDGLYAEPGLLAYGWSLANDERWSEAMPVWRYLQQNGRGLPALQATHALAYGYEHLTDYRQAYSMLEQSLEQLESARISLQKLLSSSGQAAFYAQLSSTSQDSITDTWPTAHQDLLVDILSGDNQPNTAKQLRTLLQLTDMYRLIVEQQEKVDALLLMLNEREQALLQRAKELPLLVMQERFSQAQQQLTQLQDKVKQAQDEPELLANAEQQAWLSRVQKAQQRLLALQAGNTLSAAQNAQLDARLARVEGILNWRLEEQRTAVFPQHSLALKEAEQAFSAATLRFQSLRARVADEQTLLTQIANERMQLRELKQRYTEKGEYTKGLQQRLVKSLSGYLVNKVKQRDAVLLEQITATQLAMLRMQDLHFTRSNAAEGRP